MKCHVSIHNYAVIFFHLILKYLGSIFMSTLGRIHIILLECQLLVTQFMKGISHKSINSNIKLHNVEQSVYIQRS